MLLYIFNALLFIACFLFQKVSAKQKVLLYSRTAGYRHDSIPNAIAALQKLGKEHDFDTVSSAEPSHFESPQWIKQFDALVFISVSGAALTSTGQVNMMKYIEYGGGYMGIHESCDALYKSPWYGRLVGAYFNYHPYIQKFTLNVESHSHPSTSFLQSTWSVFDEVYNFNSDPRDLNKTVVLTADASSINDPGNSAHELAIVEGIKHPIAWYKEGDLLDSPEHEIGGGVDDNSSTPKDQRGNGGAGRAFFTALGHTKACWKNKTFLDHINGGLHWVLQSSSIRSNDASLPSSAPGSEPILSANQSSSIGNIEPLIIKGTNIANSVNANTTNVKNPSALHAANAAPSRPLPLHPHLAWILLISTFSILIVL